jgi:hypothetical protein
MVSTGDRIKVDGKEATVTARHAAGRHTKFILSDGREMLDLHKCGNVELLSGSAPALKPKSVPERAKERYTFGKKKQGTVEDVREESPNGEDLLD